MLFSEVSSGEATTEQKAPVLEKRKIVSKTIVHRTYSNPYSKPAFPITTSPRSATVNWRKDVFSRIKCIKLSYWCFILYMYSSIVWNGHRHGIWIWWRRTATLVCRGSIEFTKSKSTFWFTLIDKYQHQQLNKKTENEAMKIEKLHTSQFHLL